MEIPLLQLRPRLYSYYQVIVKANLNRQVFLVENNAGFHQKAQRVTEEERRNFDIKVASHSLNSPDLYFIETVFDYIKNSLKKYNLGENEAGETAQQRAKVIISKEWNEYQEVVVTAIVKGFKDKL